MRLLTPIACGLAACLIASLAIPAYAENGFTLKVEDKAPPTPEQIAANKKKWGYAG